MKPVRLANILDLVTYRYVVRALKSSKGCRTHAARLLGIKRSTLNYRIQVYGLAEKFPPQRRYRRMKKDPNPYRCWPAIEDFAE